VLIGSSEGQDISALKRKHCLETLESEQRTSSPTQTTPPPPISRLGKERSLADFDRLRAQRAANTASNCSVFHLISQNSSRNQSKTSCLVYTPNGSRSLSSRTPSRLGSCTVCAYQDQSTICAGISRLHILWSTLPFSTTICAEESERYYLRPGVGQT
jgi:hypothetical protein